MSQTTEYERAAAVARETIEARHTLETLARTDVDAAYLLVQRAHRAVIVARLDGTRAEQEGTRGELRDAIQHYRALLDTQTEEQLRAHRQRLGADAVTEPGVMALQGVIAGAA